MERFLGALEHSFWLYDQVHPVHFALCATISGQFSLAQLRRSLAQAQEQHPLLRVQVAVDPSGRPKFVEQSGEIPLRLVSRSDDHQWQRELETELSHSFDWAIAPLARVVLLPSEETSELIVTCHHAIAEGLSVAYLIRDIVQGLESENLVTTSLLDTRPIETVIPQEYIAAVSQPVSEITKNEVEPSTYSTIVSTRSRPHIRATLLSADLTQQLSDRCRIENTTVHGAVSAAFLLAIAHQTNTLSSPLNCLSPINVRSHLSPSVGESMGMYISYGKTTHELSSDSSLWEVARSLKSQLNEAMHPSYWFENIAQRHAVISTLPDAQTIADGMQQQYNYQLLATNLGRLNLQQQFGSLRLEALYGPAVMADLAQERIVGIATWGDRLSLTLSCTATLSNLAATTLLVDAVQRLQNSVTATQLDLTYPHC